ncbi:MAG: 16S rRNA (uracil(1498)-N(3))-methyltransferase [Porticoccaceae bacterium]|mgnify:CR=1 FL=1|nr:16S rRNA (uracil(1498)-N(3))-methyltransferase [Porticoccaceae bacterium]
MGQLWMRIPRIFVDIDLDSNVEVTLDGAQTHYLRTVLKLTHSDPIVVFNGKGGEYSGVLSSSSKTSVTVQLEKFDPEERESPLRTHLGIGVSRGERMSYAIQKATELGVSRITPLITARCEVKLSESRKIRKVDQWQRVVVNACQQSKRTRVPEVTPIIDLNKWCEKTRSSAKFILDTDGDEPFDSIADNPEDVAILVGPEGGFEEKELSVAVQFGFKRLRLGPRVLRAETAPLVALSILQSVYGDVP